MPFAHRDRGSSKRWKEVGREDRRRVRRIALRAVEARDLDDAALVVDHANSWFRHRLAPLLILISLGVQRFVDHIRPGLGAVFLWGMVVAYAVGLVLFIACDVRFARAKRVDRAMLGRPGERPSSP